MNRLLIALALSACACAVLGDEDLARPGRNFGVRVPVSNRGGDNARVVVRAKPRPAGAAGAAQQPRFSNFPAVNSHPAVVPESIPVSAPHQSADNVHVPVVPAFKPRAQPLPLPIVEPVAFPTPTPVNTQEEESPVFVPVKPVARPQAPRQPKQAAGAKSVPTADFSGNSPDENGNYDFRFQTSDGVTREETGVQKNLGGTESANEITGQVSWTSPEGELITLNYVANENGFQPVGSHVPQAPPVHPAIQRGLDLIARSNARKQNSN